MRGLATLIVVGGCMAAGAAPAAQVEVDRTLRRVYGTAIMASDVREARVLKLLPASDGSDEALLTALENRLLMLREVSRVPAAEPARDAIATRRRAWEAGWAPGTDLAALMARVGTSDQALDGWFRDDLQISAYLDQRFGAQTDASRAARIVEWIAELRRRANLPVKIALVTHEGLKE